MYQTHKFISFATLLCFLSGFVFSSVVAQDSKVFYKHFKGKIAGKHEVVMDLNRQGDKFIGSYYYTKYKTPMAISGKIQGNQILLKEYNPNRQATGSFIGKITGKTFSGTWDNVDKTKSLTFDLTEDYSESVFFEMYTTEQSEDLRKNLQNSAKADLSVEYLYPKNYTNSDILQKLQSQFKELTFVGNTPKEENPTEQLKNYQTSFFGTYHQDYSEISDEDAQSYAYNQTMEITTGILFNERQLLTAYFQNYQYMGGAHGNSNSTYKVFDLQTGKPLKLSDILQDGHETKLSKMIENEIREQLEIPDNESLKEFGLFENSVKPNQNFYLDRSGIGFFYNRYELAAYVFPPFDVYIPFSKIKGMLKTEGVIKRLLD